MITINLTFLNSYTKNQVIHATTIIKNFPDYDYKTDNLIGTNKEIGQLAIFYPELLNLDRIHYN